MPEGGLRGTDQLRPRGIAVVPVVDREPAAQQPGGLGREPARPVRRLQGGDPAAVVDRQARQGQGGLQQPGGVGLDRAGHVPDLDPAVAVAQHEPAVRADK